ncbi:MAG: alpha/beta fold hydrolase [Burkholderiales bacterium]|jgi:polyhydroxyalkanoate synthase|nr:alpha/beta fold hydrolase [Burkholderiales bacterium]
MTPVTLQRAALQNITKNVRDRMFKASSMVVAGQLPYDVVHQADLASVRHYHPLNDTHIVVNGKEMPVAQTRHKIPLLVVAPLAVNMLIYDLFPERSFIKYLLAQGFDVYLVDWGKPGLKHASYSLSNYMFDMLPSCVAAVRQHSGSSKLSLHGWSMGGMLAAVYAATTTENDVENLVMLGTPFNGHANGAIGGYYKRMNTLLRRTGLSLRRLPARVAYTPGWMNVIGFKMMDPVASVKGYISLAKQIGDRDYVEQHANQAAFIDHLEAYPGGVIRDFTSCVLLENETFLKGRMRLGNRVVHFGNITANLLVVTGRKDNLATTQACMGVMKVVSSQDKELFVGGGGHIGILGGSEALKSIWPKTVAWLEARSAAANPTDENQTSSGFNEANTALAA